MFFSFPFLCVLCSLHLYFPVLFCFICVSSFLVSQSVYFLFYFKHTFSTAFLCFYFPSLFFFVLCLFCFLLFNYWQSAVPQSQLRGHHKLLHRTTLSCCDGPVVRKDTTRREWCGCKSEKVGKGSVFFQSIIQQLLSLHVLSGEMEEDFSCLTLTKF